VRVEPLGRRLHLSAGDPDLGFSGDGRAALNFPGAPFVVADTAVATDGKVVVGGTKGLSMAVARFNADGTLDTGFGNGGLFESSRSAAVTSVAVQGDGKIVLGLGPVTDPGGLDLQIGRLLANGMSFDPGFGANGVAHIAEEWDGSTVNDVMVQRDGKILGAGSVSTSDILDIEREFAVVRYEADGSPDASFGGGDGVHDASMGGFDEATAVTVDYNGNNVSNPLYGTIVAVGGGAGISDRFQVLRLRPDGGADGGLDGDGKLTSPDLSSLGAEQAVGVVVQAGGKIVVAGTAYSPSDGNLRKFLVARYNPGGTLDAAFGGANSGSTQLDLGGRDEVGAIAIGYHSTVGNLIVSGGRNGQFAVAALTPDGTLDSRFSGDGILTTTIPGIATGLFATGNMFPPVRKLVLAGGNGQVARYVDVGSLISVGTFQPQMYEQGAVGTSFVVARTVALPFAETVVLNTIGTATTLGSSRDFNASGVLFGNGQTTSTEVVIPAGATTATAVLTPVDDALVEGDETIGFDVLTALTYDAGATHSTTLVVRDNDTVGGPVVIDSGFGFETYPQRATIAFNQSVVTTFTVGDLEVTRTGGGAAPLYSLDYDNVTNTGTVVFYNGLVDGDYTARVKSSGVKSVGGVPMAADHTFGFFVLAGDANRDRKVDFQDLVVLAQNYNAAGKAFGEGDFSYNGAVDFADLVILAQRYNTSLPTPAPSVLGADLVSPAAGAVYAARDSDTSVFASAPLIRAPAARPRPLPKYRQ
jgi:uncharacterized delta-60 repeat protein